MDSDIIYFIIICVAFIFFVIAIVLVLMRLASNGAEKEMKKWDDVKNKILEEKFGKQVIITHCPLTTPKDEVFAMAKDDEYLIKSIAKYKEKLHRQKIETFDSYRNIIVTEKGYFCAFYSRELTKVKQ